MLILHTYSDIYFIWKLEYILQKIVNKALQSFQMQGLFI
jgi:hypothetical protein